VKRFRNVTPSSRSPQTSLTAREVREAIEERISKGVYALGQRLPPLRSIAAELGTSPSTVSRAVQEMIRNGWLDVAQAGIDDGGGVIFWRHAAGDALRDRACGFVCSILVQRAEQPLSHRTSEASIVSRKDS
jgi:DNA-binding transcriptional MocR family regulator